MIELVVIVSFLIIFTLSFIDIFDSITSSFGDIVNEARDVSTLSNFAIIGNVVFANSSRNPPGTTNSSLLSQIWLLRSNDAVNFDFANMKIGDVSFTNSSTNIKVANINTAIEGVVPSAPYYVSFNSIWNSKLFDSKGAISLQYRYYQHIYNVHYYVSYGNTVVPFNFTYLVEPSYYTPAVYTVQTMGTNVLQKHTLSLTPSKLPNFLTLVNPVTTYRNDGGNYDLDSSNVYSALSSYWGVPSGKSMYVSLSILSSTSYYLRLLNAYAYYQGTDVPINGVSVSYYAPGLVPGKDSPTYTVFSGSATGSYPFPSNMGYAVLNNVVSGGLVYIDGRGLGYGERILQIP